MEKKKSNKKPKESNKSLVSSKRAKAIEETFKTLNLVTQVPYQGAEQTGNSFKRFSLYDSEGYSFFTSNKIFG